MTWSAINGQAIHHLHIDGIRARLGASEADARNELALIIGGAELSVDEKEAGVVSMAIVGTPVIDPLQ